MIIITQYPKSSTGCRKFKFTNRLQGVDYFKTTNYPQLADDFNKTNPLKLAIQRKAEDGDVAENVAKYVAKKVSLTQMKVE